MINKKGSKTDEFFRIAMRFKKHLEDVIIERLIDLGLEESG